MLSLGQEASELAATLKISRRELQERVRELEEERRGAKQAYEAGLADLERRHEGVARELRERIWARDEEIKVRAAGLCPGGGPCRVPRCTSPALQKAPQKAPWD